MNKYFYGVIYHKVIKENMANNFDSDSLKISFVIIISELLLTHSCVK
jgi:hypothetical protein